MTDRLDDLLFSIGEEQNGRVDFDQMYADLLQKQKEEEKKRSIRRSRFVRYGAMAACAVALVGIGAAMVNSSRFKAEAPAEAAMTEECVEESAPAEEAPAEAAPAEEPMMAEAQEAADTAATEAAPEEGADDKGFKSTATAGRRSRRRDRHLRRRMEQAEGGGHSGGAPYDSEDAPGGRLCADDGRGRGDMERRKRGIQGNAQRRHCGAAKGALRIKE